MEVPGGMNGLQFTVKTLKEVGSEAGALAKLTAGGISDAAKWSGRGVAGAVKWTGRGVADAAKWTGNRISDVADIAAWSAGGIASNTKKVVSGANKRFIKKPFDIATAGVVSAVSVAAVAVAANHSREGAAKNANDTLETAALGGQWVSRVSEPAAADLGSVTPTQPTR